MGEKNERGWGGAGRKLGESDSYRDREREETGDVRQVRESSGWGRLNERPI